MEVSNLEFLRVLYAGAAEGAKGHVTGFNRDPQDVGREAWAGVSVDLPVNGKLPIVVSNPTWNTYAAQGTYTSGRRKKEQLAGIHSIFIDDIGTKGERRILPGDLPLRPSWVLETAPGNFQVGYLLHEPTRVDIKRWDRLAKALAGLYGDKGARDLTRYLRLPVGSNLKAEYGTPFPHQMHTWEPELRYSLEQIAEAFDIDLDAGGAQEDAGDGTGAAEWLSDIHTGENFHEAINRLVARYVALGVSRDEVVTLAQAVMAQSDAPRDERWRDRYEDIPRSVDTAIEKGYGKKPEPSIRFGQEETPDAEGMALPPTVQEFLELEFPAIEPLLGPICTQQLVILYAAPGAGKTQFQLALSHALAGGTDFLGWRSGRRARVLIVDGEMAGEMMQTRLAGAGLGGDWLRVANLPNWGGQSGYETLNLASEEGQKTVGDWAAACRTDVIILDNLMSLAWMDGISMNSDEFWQPIRRFCVWQRSLGRTVVVVDHMNKSGGIHGTGTKLWHADLAIELRPLEAGEPTLSNPCPEARFSLKFAKVRGTPENAGQDYEEKAITIGRVGQDWVYEGGREHKKQKAREMALNGLSVRDISEEIGVSKSTVGRWVKSFGSR